MVDVDQEIDRAAWFAVHAGEVLNHSRREGLSAEKRLQLMELPGLIAKGNLFGGSLEKEIERVVDGHLCNQIDLDAELAHAIGKREPRDVVALWILLPVDEVLVRCDALRIREDARAAVRRWAQAHQLRRQHDGAIVLIMCDVTQGDVNAHTNFLVTASPRLSRAPRRAHNSVDL